MLRLEATAVHLPRENRLADRRIAEWYRTGKRLRSAVALDGTEIAAVEHEMRGLGQRTDDAEKIGQLATSPAGVPDSTEGPRHTCSGRDEFGTAVPRTLKRHVRGRVRQLAEVGKRPANGARDESGDLECVVALGDLRDAVMRAQEVLSRLIPVSQKMRERCRSTVLGELGGDVVHLPCIVTHGRWSLCEPHSVTVRNRRVVRSRTP